MVFHPPRLLSQIGCFTAAVSSSRSYLHADIRNAVAELAIILIEDEDSSHAPFSITDLFRGTRIRVTDLSPEDPVRGMFRPVLRASPYAG